MEEVVLVGGPMHGKVVTVHRGLPALRLVEREPAPIKPFVEEPNQPVPYKTVEYLWSSHVYASQRLYVIHGLDHRVAWAGYLMSVVANH